MPKRIQHSSCELPVRARNKAAVQSRHLRFQGDFRWKGVKVLEYKTKGADWSGIIRQTLTGDRGEKTKFHLRYFEIQAGGYSSLETHTHEHVVICIRGRGKARLNRRNIDIGFLNILYINPDAPHRLFNPYDEPFGFFCIVDAERDRPRPVNSAYQKGDSVNGHRIFSKS